MCTRNVLLLDLCLQFYVLSSDPISSVLCLLTLLPLMPVVLCTWICEWSASMIFRVHGSICSPSLPIPGSITTSRATNTLRRFLGSTPPSARAAQRKRRCRHRTPGAQVFIASTTSTQQDRSCCCFTVDPAKKVSVRFWTWITPESLVQSQLLSVSIGWCLWWILGGHIELFCSVIFLLLP
jgi:hypothetical protein